MGTNHPFNPIPPITQARLVIQKDTGAKRADYRMVNIIRCEQIRQEIGMTPREFSYALGYSDEAYPGFLTMT